MIKKLLYATDSILNDWKKIYITSPSSDVLPNGLCQDENEIA